ncbi:hypothetical protein WJX74_006129 [Apatococcus lobatus]|uniref:Uncharacterized protein n=1 Tax=Apatococcus lobatus TaxID=904363 RepID=A0AAW1QU86_9CHLO
MASKQGASSVEAAMAIVKAHQNKFTSLHPPTKAWQVWRPSAWADFFFLHSTMDSELRIGSLQARSGRVRNLLDDASLRIAGSIDDVRVTTLPEVLALVKFRGVAFTSRHPRTPMKQFWRPSAWADAWYGYYPGKTYYELSEIPMLKSYTAGTRHQ